MEEYNKVASLMDWKPIDSPTTVENWRQKFALTTMAGNKGDKALKNTRMKQIHREAPTQALTYWTLDGWDAELFYQKKTPKTVKKNGEEKRYMYTTYTNRKTMVVVLDACEKYPVGYAIGDHESPALIREALRIFGRNSPVTKMMSVEMIVWIMTRLASLEMIPARRWSWIICAMKIP